MGEPAHELADEPADELEDEPADEPADEITDKSLDKNAETLEDDHSKTVEEGHAETAEENNQVTPEPADEENYEKDHSTSDNLVETDKTSNERNKNDSLENQSEDDEISRDIKENGHNLLQENKHAIVNTDNLTEIDDIQNETRVDPNSDTGPNSLEDNKITPSKRSNIIRDEGDDTTAIEGNNNSSVINEDDDDVQVPGDTSSEYSEYNLKSTAEASDIGSAKIGKNEITSGTAHAILKT